MNKCANFGFTLAKKKEKPFNNPFASVGAELKKQLKTKKKEQVKKRKAQKPVAPQQSTDQELFERAMAGTARIDDEKGNVTPALPPDTADNIPIYDEDAEAYAELVDLVEGKARFDISDSDEFISGCIEGLDKRVLQKLKRNEYAVNNHLDLHGMTRDVAREAVDKFIAEGRRQGHRCVLIVHGRGLNSKDKIPVLKDLLKSWFERGRLSRSILAFCTARPHDGGQGALYVLLRRQQ